MELLFVGNCTGVSRQATPDHPGITP
jgi:hypothetical protein